MPTDRVDVKKLLYNLVGVHDFGLTLTVIVVCGRVVLLLIRDFVLREKLSMGMLALRLQKKTNFGGIFFSVVSCFININSR